MSARILSRDPKSNAARYCLHAHMTYFSSSTVTVSFFVSRSETDDVGAVAILPEYGGQRGPSVRC